VKKLLLILGLVSSGVFAAALPSPNPNEAKVLVVNHTNYSLACGSSNAADSIPPGSQGDCDRNSIIYMSVTQGAVKLEEQWKVAAVAMLFHNAPRFSNPTNMGVFQLSGLISSVAVGHGNLLHSIRDDASCKALKGHVTLRTDGHIACWYDGGFSKIIFNS
jgi:hypothetical protein